MPQKKMKNTGMSTYEPVPSQIWKCISNPAKSGKKLNQVQPYFLRFFCDCCP